MSNDKNRYPTTEAIERMFDFIQGPEVDINTLPIEIVRDELKKEQIDVSSLVSAVQGRLADERMRIARQKRIALDKEASDTKLRLTTADIKAKISRLFEMQPALAVEYRNFKEASPEDIEGLFEDLKLLGYFDESK